MAKIIKTHGDKAYAINLKFVPKDYPTLIFGQQLKIRSEIQKWLKTAKKGYVGAKNKPTLTSVRNWVSEVKPKEFYAVWRKDSKFYKDDCVEIYYN